MGVMLSLEPMPGRYRRRRGQHSRTALARARISTAAALRRAGRAVADWSPGRAPDSGLEPPLPAAGALTAVGSLRSAGESAVHAVGRAVEWQRTARAEVWAGPEVAAVRDRLRPLTYSLAMAGRVGPHRGRR